MNHSRIKQGTLPLAFQLLLATPSLAQLDTQTLWVVTSGPTLYRVDDYSTGNPLVQQIGPTQALHDIAVNPIDGELYGVLGARLFRVDKTTGVATLLFDSLNGGTNNGLDFDPDGVLYMRTSTDHNLRTVDVSTGVVTVVGSTGSACDGDVAVDLDGFLLGAVDPNHLDRVDPATGQGTVIGSFGVSDVWGLDIDCDGTVYAVRFDGSFYTVDRGTGATTLLSSLGVTGDIWGIAFERTAPCAPGTSYCSPAVPNSSGQPATIATAGSVFVVDNDLTLFADNLPAGEFGYFLVGSNQGTFMPPGSQGMLCLSCSGFQGCAGIGRYNQMGNIIQGPMGSITVDLTSLPLFPPRAVQPGEVWNFQCWFRDLGSSNFTDAVSISFR